jgi:hypothetical protein
MSDILILWILSVISLIVFIKMCKGGSCDYKTRIRVYEAVYEGEICFVDTKRPAVVAYIDETCKEYDYDKKKFKIVIKYMSKLKYSLMREL